MLFLFRHFAEDSKCFNTLKPTRETQASMEQPACVHATMDLFKWAAKLYPWASSELVLQSLELAISAREIDMRASPYDLRLCKDNSFLEFDCTPIKIETRVGRKQYQLAQMELMHRSIPIRRQLIELYSHVINKIQS